MLLANKQDFEQGGLYDPPYQDFEYFGLRADTIREIFPNCSTIAIWGCGWGYLNKYLMDDYQVNGYDASQYAIDKTVVPGITLADCTNPDDVQNSIKVDLLITEDLLPCLSDDEIAVALRSLSKVADNVCHIVTPNDTGGTDHDQRINWKTSDEWKALVTPAVLLDSNGVKL